MLSSERGRVRRGRRHKNCRVTHVRFDPTRACFWVHPVTLRCAVTLYEESMWWSVLTISSLRSEIVIVSFVGVVPRRLPAAKEMRLPNASIPVGGGNGDSSWSVRKEAVSASGKVILHGLRVAEGMEGPGGKSVGELNHSSDQLASLCDVLCIFNGMS